MIHGSDVVEILDVLKHTPGLSIEHIESSLLNQLSDELQSNLIAPFVHKRHGKIINEHGHHFVSRGSEVFSYFEVTFLLNCRLEHERLSGARKIDSFKQLLLVKLATV
jgi:hypothetical protein